MSYSKFSPAKFDSDQKDVLISQLKAENFELRQNMRDFNELSSDLKKLEHHYSILSEEKLRNESEFRNRNEINMKTIANLRSDVDQLKSALTEKHIEFQEERAANMANKEIADHRGLDLTRLKNELTHLTEINQRLGNEKAQLDSDFQLLKEEKRKLIDEVDLLTQNCDTLISKNNELEKSFRESEYERTKLEKQQIHLKSQLESLDIELKNKSEAIRYNNLQQQEMQSQLTQMQNDLDELEKLKEKYKQESQHFQKNYQQENSRNFELSQQIINLENIIKQRDNQIIDQKSEIDGLKRAHSDAIDQNDMLSSELDTYKRNYELSNQQNQELINELDMFSDQDEQVRQILNRRMRVKELKLKAENLQRNSLNDIIRTSPKKFNKSTIINQ